MRETWTTEGCRRRVVTSIFGSGAPKVGAGMVSHRHTGTRSTNWRVPWVKEYLHYYHRYWSQMVCLLFCYVHSQGGAVDRVTR